ncbi:unnamed protein product [Calicophoron daubneyi]|uniref:C2H2-type domain-containing protein n=1 Tax=Calicophoron daubneyi TaxID=300641 RepID=A0AAV2TWH5_CALDB
MVVCSTCQVSFTSNDERISHTKSEWHVYNLKRVVANLPPIPEDLFKEKRRCFSKPATEPEKDVYCFACKTVFSSDRTYEAHLKSRKHLRNLEFRRSQPFMPPAIRISPYPRETPEHPVIHSDERVLSKNTKPLPLGSCFFCDTVFYLLGDEQSLARRVMEHMQDKHNFTVPYPNRLVNAAGLLRELGRIIGEERACLYCGHQFHGPEFFDAETKYRSSRISLQALRTHMLQTSGHLKVWCGQEDPVELALLVARAEEENSDAPPPAAQAGGELYSQYYDGSLVSPSFVLPDAEDEEIYEVRLPSGTVISHRKMRTVYQQRLTGTLSTLDRALPVHNVESLGFQSSTALAPSRAGLLATNRQQGCVSQKARASERLATEEHRKDWDLSVGVHGNAFNRLRLRKQN